MKKRHFLYITLFISFVLFAADLKADVIYQVQINLILFNLDYPKKVNIANTFLSNRKTPVET